ncbi:MAG: CopG family transcriptional regulator [bacterium]
MTEFTRKATIYLDPQLHRALRIKSAETSRSISDLINEAVRFSLAEDAEDLTAFTERANEPLFAFEDVLKELKKNGLI